MLTKMTIESPFGPVQLVARGDALCTVMPGVAELPHATECATGVLARAARQLDEYFVGKRRVFDLALAPDGTAFQRIVWDMLARIPYGATWSYGQLARAIGRPAASRAVGAANGRNPIWIVVPCHRVIGASGQLTGYAGGLAMKRWLLAHETDQLSLYSTESQQPHAPSSLAR